MVPMVSYSVIWSLLSVRGVCGAYCVLQCLVVSVVVPEFFYGVCGVCGAYGVPQCLMVSVVVPHFL